MAYIGVSPSNGVRRVHTYTATASQTTFSGAGAEGATLSYKDSNFVDVYQNGVKLGDADYTATSGTSIVLGTGASASDLVVIVVFDVFSVADTVSKADGGTFDGNVTMAGTLGVTGATTLTGGVSGNTTFSNNVTITGDLASSTSGTSNFRAGVNAGNSIASGGNFNTVVGDEAGTALTTGDDNTAFGYGALYSEDAHGKNTAVGTNSLLTLNAGADGYNTAVGYFSGRLITTGVQNTLVGSNAGDALTDADYNTALGYLALSNDTQGSLSTAIGKSALATQNLTSATNTFNVGVGAGAGEQVTTGVENTLVGGVAGDALTDADHNVAIGFHALSSDTKGNRTTAIGRYAAYNQNFTSSTDTNNVYIGYYAGADATTGVRNTIVGSLGAEELTTADDCVGIGYLCLGGDADLATTGHDNVSIGSHSGKELTSGFSNTIVGRSAGDDLTTGYQNTFVGKGAGNVYTSGYRNICIGDGAQGSASDRYLAYTIGSQLTSAGYGGLITIGQDNGNDRIYNSFQSNASWTRVSDERYKKDITTNTDCGLDFINDLRTVTFKWKAKSELDKDVPGYNPEETEPNCSHKLYGLIAQEVKSALDKHNITDFGGHDIIEESGIQSISQEMFVMPLIKSIQELSTQVTALQAEVKALKGE